MQGTHSRRCLHPFPNSLYCSLRKVLSQWLVWRTELPSLYLFVTNIQINRIWRSIWIFILPWPKNVRVRFLLRLKRVADVRLCFELIRSFTRENQTDCPTLLYRFRMREISKLTTLSNVSGQSILSVKTGKGNSFIPTNSNLWDLPGY